MANQYGGILGALAMAIAFARGAAAGAGLEGTATQAIASAAVLAMVGLVVGGVAQRTVDESVRTRMDKQLAELGVRPDPAASGESSPTG